MPQPSHALALALTCVLAGACASKIPDPEPLCGTWSDGAGMTERWWLDGKDLRGEGKTPDGSETLELIASRGGHVYVARPGGAPPTEFAPIDPASARWGGRPPAQSIAWVWANYDHDFPQEIHYVLDVDGELHATIAGPGDETSGDHGGRSMGWTLQRVAACSEEPK